jgi:hypothetical protein
MRRRVSVILWFTKLENGRNSYPKGFGMSHRDEDCRTASRSFAQELRAVIDELWSQRESDAVAFKVRPDCHWAARGLTIAALIWVWSTKPTLGERFTQTLAATQTFGCCLAPAKVSYQAFIKLLGRWTQQLATALKASFRTRMEQEGRRHRIAGFAVFAVDGSKLLLPRTQSNEDRYAPKKTRKRRPKGRKNRRVRRPRSAAARARHARNKKADSPQMALTTAFHVGLRLPWDWRLGSSDTSEREHVRDMIADLPPNAIIAADCGFVGYEFWSDLLKSGKQFVIRIGGNVKLLKKLGTARESNNLVYLWPNQAAKRRQPPLVLRLVVVHDGRQTWYLVTSVLEAQRLSDADVAKIYQQRWGIELFFRHFKQTFHRAKLRSHKAENAACEAEWSLLGLWAMLLYAHIQRQRGGAVGRVSVARVLRAFGEAIEHHDRLTKPGETLIERLLAATIDPYTRADKRSRSHPRKKYESVTKRPSILTATHTQRQLAQDVIIQSAA